MPFTTEIINTANPGKPLGLYKQRIIGDNGETILQFHKIQGIGILINLVDDVIQLSTVPTKYSQETEIYVSQTKTLLDGLPMQPTEIGKLGYVIETNKYYTWSGTEWILDEDPYTLDKSIKHNFNAISAPTITNGSNEGYEKGSQWLMETGLWMLSEFDENNYPIWIQLYPCELETAPKYYVGNKGIGLEHSYAFNYIGELIGATYNSTTSRIDISVKSYTEFPGTTFTGEEGVLYNDNGTLKIYVNGIWQTVSGGGSSEGGHIIRQDGIIDDFTKRKYLTFYGTPVEIIDNPTDDSTDISISLPIDPISICTEFIIPAGSTSVSTLLLENGAIYKHARFDYVMRLGDGLGENDYQNGDINYTIYEQYHTSNYNISENIELLISIDGDDLNLDITGLTGIAEDIAFFGILYNYSCDIGIGPKGDKGDKGDPGENGVEMYDAVENFPATGDISKLYIDNSTGDIYNWNGIDYYIIASNSGDVINVTDFESLPETGEDNKIYITNDEKNTYIWTGTDYKLLNSPGTINDEGTSLIETWSSKKISRLFELSRIRAVSNLTEMQDACTYFAQLTPRGGIILVVDTIEITGAVDLDLRGITVKGTGGGRFGNLSYIWFKNENSLLNINTALLEPSAVDKESDSVIFENMKFRGHVDLSNFGQTPNYTRFYLKRGVGSLSFNNCHFQSMNGVHTFIAASGIGNDLIPICVSNPTIKIEVFNYSTYYTQTSQCTKIEIINCSFSDYTFSGVNKNLCGLSIHWDGANLKSNDNRNNFQITVQGLTSLTSNIIYLNHYSRLIISNRNAKAQSSQEIFSSLDNSANFTYPSAINTLDNIVTVQNYGRLIDLGRKFLIENQITASSLNGTDEIIIKTGEYLMKISLSELKAWINL